jgi:hypothetical protein
VAVWHGAHADLFARNAVAASAGPVVVDDTIRFPCRLAKPRPRRVEKQVDWHSRRRASAVHGSDSLAWSPPPSLVGCLLSIFLSQNVVDKVYRLLNDLAQGGVLMQGGCPRKETRERRPRRSRGHMVQGAGAGEPGEEKIVQ